jgi:hypothetical protein
MAGVERGRYQALETHEDGEGESVLSDKFAQPSLRARLLQPSYSLYHLIISFAIGGLICTVALYAIFPMCYSTSSKPQAAIMAPPWVGSTEVHPFPAPSPTNAFSSLFPIRVGYAGATPTGAEPAVILTAPSYPVHTGAPQLVAPTSLGGAKTSGKNKFHIFKKWGNLSPWYSNDVAAFGLNSTSQPPETCRVTGLHLLHRHGARYPTAWCSQHSFTG